MLPKIIRIGIHRYEGTGVRKTEMATQYRKAYVPVTLDVDKEGGNPPSPYLVGQRCNLSNRPDSLQMPRNIQEGWGAEASVTQFRFTERSRFFFTKETSGSSKQRRTTAHDFIPAPT